MTQGDPSSAQNLFGGFEALDDLSEAEQNIVLRGLVRQLADDKRELIDQAVAEAEGGLSRRDILLGFIQAKSDAHQLRIANQGLQEENRRINEAHRAHDIDSKTGFLTLDAWTREVLILSQQRRNADEDKTNQILFCDLDHFKAANDLFGHTKVDELILKQVGKAMQKAMPRGNGSIGARDLIGRYGGEEFVAYLDDTPSEGALTVANRIIEHVNEITFPNGAKIHDRTSQGISIGVASFGPGIDLDDALTNADVALYASKSGGRNMATIYAPDLDPNA